MKVKGRQTFVEGCSLFEESFSDVGDVSIEKVEVVNAPSTRSTGDSGDENGLDVVRITERCDVLGTLKDVI